jgi:signal transduction histidine kinase/phage shock protein PspC (stress-responsive transcriptional regulator)
MRACRPACDDQGVTSSTQTAAPTAGPAAAAPRRLTRVSRGRLLAGVARGLAEHLGVDPLIIRVLFVVLAAAGGAGLLMYGGFWVFAPLQPDSSEARVGEPDPGGRAQQDLGMLLALGSLALGGALLLSALGIGLNPDLAVPLAVVGVGVVILWRQADDAQRERWRAATATHRVPDAVRASIGIALVLIGGAAILIGPVDLKGISGGLAAAIVVTVGLALVSGPWWMRMIRELDAERRARIREQERAEVAAHVHDSVLHTLTLIQRHVDNPREVARLARAQERELRGWLYRPRADPAATVTSEVNRVAAEVEDAHGVAIEVVVVGDAPLDESLGAVLDATREALVNAAKYARDAPISVYAEVEPGQVTVFVRDRGPGFDLAAVPEDRLGLRQSVIGRMQRHGGVATVRSAAGEGTEVQLEMPRSSS